MNIIAVVVTYNRIELLKRTVRCLQQNKPVSSIVVVNNGSTDATAEWLKTQSGLTVINHKISETVLEESPFSFNPPETRKKLHCVSINSCYNDAKNA